MKKNKLMIVGLACLGATCASACSPFLFIKQNETVVPFAGTTNTLFFALYNYYGIKDQHFTNKWLGMNDALADHGITVTGYEAEKDAKKFKISYDRANSDLPKDAKVYMVNNQTWDTGLQYNKPLANQKPMAVISTCNGVEFAANAIKASGLGTQNATMGGFCTNYYNAFKAGSLSYLVTKYTAHVAPIFAACVDAVDNGKAMKNADGTALSLSVVNWAIKSLEEYETMSAVDQYELNDTVQAYMDYMMGYLADVYNVEVKTESITSSNTQSIGCKALVDSNVDFIISLQDDTDRNAAIKIADENNVFFGIAGTCQNPTDYAATKDYAHYVGSVGTSIEEERRAAKEMTEYYLQKMIERNAAQGGK